MQVVVPATVVLMLLLLFSQSAKLTLARASKIQTLLSTIERGKTHQYQLGLMFLHLESQRWF
jgi:hypothetical protein